MPTTTTYQYTHAHCAAPNMDFAEAHASGHIIDEHARAELTFLKMTRRALMRGFASGKVEETVREIKDLTT